MVKRLVVAAAVLVLAACQSSHVLVGQKRAPIDPAQVRVYIVPPAQFEQVAMLEASSAASGAFTSQQKTDKVITRLKGEAAALGANGILLGGVGNQYGGSVNTGNAFVSGNQVFGSGISVPVMHKAGSAVAIYVPAGYEAPPRVEASVPAPAASPSPAAQPLNPNERDPSKRCDSCQRIGRP